VNQNQAWINRYLQHGRLQGPIAEWAVIHGPIGLDGHLVYRQGGVVLHHNRSAGFTIRCFLLSLSIGCETEPRLLAAVLHCCFPLELTEDEGKEEEELLMLGDNGEVNSTCWQCGGS
jgi:hypothetical protein